MPQSTASLLSALDSLSYKKRCEFVGKLGWKLQQANDPGLDLIISELAASPTHWHGQIAVQLARGSKRINILVDLLSHPSKDVCRIAASHLGRLSAERQSVSDLFPKLSLIQRGALLKALMENPQKRAIADYLLQQDFAWLLNSSERTVLFQYCSSEMFVADLDASNVFVVNEKLVQAHSSAIAQWLARRLLTTDGEAQLRRMYCSTAALARTLCKFQPQQIADLLVAFSGTFAVEWCSVWTPLLRQFRDQVWPVISIHTTHLGRVLSKRVGHRLTVDQLKFVARHCPLPNLLRHVPKALWPELIAAAREGLKPDAIPVDLPLLCMLPRDLQPAELVRVMQLKRVRENSDLQVMMLVYHPYAMASPKLKELAQNPDMYARGRAVGNVIKCVAFNHGDGLHDALQFVLKYRNDADPARGQIYSELSSIAPFIDVAHVTLLRELIQAAVDALDFSSHSRNGLKALVERILERNCRDVKSPLFEFGLEMFGKVQVPIGSRTPMWLSVQPGLYAHLYRPWLEKLLSTWHTVSAERGDTIAVRMDDDEEETAVTFAPLIAYYDAVIQIAELYPSHEYEKLDGFTAHLQSVALDSRRFNLLQQRAVTCWLCCKASRLSRARTLLDVDKLSHNISELVQLIAVSQHEWLDELLARVDPSMHLLLWPGVRFDRWLPRQQHVFRSKCLKLDLQPTDLALALFVALPITSVQDLSPLLVDPVAKSSDDARISSDDEDFEKVGEALGEKPSIRLFELALRSCMNLNQSAASIPTLLKHVSNSHAKTATFALSRILRDQSVQTLLKIAVEILALPRLKITTRKEAFRWIALGGWKIAASVLRKEAARVDVHRDVLIAIISVMCPSMLASEDAWAVMEMASSNPKLVKEVATVLCHVNMSGAGVRARHALNIIRMASHENHDIQVIALQGLVSWTEGVEDDVVTLALPLALNVANLQEFDLGLQLLVKCGCHPSGARALLHVTTTLVSQPSLPGSDYLSISRVLSLCKAVCALQTEGVLQQIVETVETHPPFLQAAIHMKLHRMKWSDPAIAASLVALLAQLEGVSPLAVSTFSAEVLTRIGGFKVDPFSRLAVTVVCMDSLDLNSQRALWLCDAFYAHGTAAARFLALASLCSVVRWNHDFVSRLQALRADQDVGVSASAWHVNVLFED
eukprot:TRINITY_DN1572_c1_g1_i1.p1 TRINITY_DN1572_c1_g1~~TRINITY_DN1572_c1_g1_i1.p1  ORF type:complete len:1157 (+),score=167.60 TRINITY_DN1572_c1_g1_i1:2941-6411(+)